MSKRLLIVALSCVVFLACVDEEPITSSAPEARAEAAAPAVQANMAAASVAFAESSVCRAMQKAQASARNVADAEPENAGLKLQAEQYDAAVADVCN